MTKNFSCFLKFLGRRTNHQKIAQLTGLRARNSWALKVWPGIMTSKNMKNTKAFNLGFHRFQKWSVESRESRMMYINTVIVFKYHITYNLVTAPPVFAEGDPMFGLIHPHPTWVDPPTTSPLHPRFQTEVSRVSSWGSAFLFMRGWESNAPSTSWHHDVKQILTPIQSKHQQCKFEAKQSQNKTPYKIIKGKESNLGMSQHPPLMCLRISVASLTPWGVSIQRGTTIEFLGFKVHTTVIKLL